MATTGRLVTYQLIIYWDFTTPTDETGSLVRASGEYRIAAPGSSILSPRGIIPQMAITLFNDGRFSSFNTSSPLYTYLRDGKAYHVPVEFSVKIDAGSFVRVFTGYLKTPTEQAVTSTAAPTISFDCRGTEERLQQQRISTTLATLAANYDDHQTEAEHITAWLTAAGDDFEPGAGDIDSGLFTIPAAWLDDESPLYDIWQLAAACGGWAYSARTGEMLYKNATYLASGAAAGDTYDKGDYTQLSIRHDDKELFSTAIVETSPRIAEPSTVLWEPDELPIVPVDDDLTLTASLRQPAYSIESVSYDAVTQGGQDLSASVSLVTTAYAQRTELAFTNASTDYAAVLRNLQIVGVPIGGGKSQEEKAETTIADGATTADVAYWDTDYNRDERTRTLRGNVYIQSRPQASMLATMLRDWHNTPRVYISTKGVMGEPDRDLLDRITISNSDILSSDIDIFVTAIRWTASKAGFRHDLEGIAAEDFYPYADDAEGYFVLGTNKLNATGASLAGRLFY